MNVLKALMVVTRRAQTVSAVTLAPATLDIGWLVMHTHAQTSMNALPKWMAVLIPVPTL